MDCINIWIITGCFIASSILFGLIICLIIKLRSKFVSTFINTKDKHGFIIFCTQKCSVKYSFFEFTIPVDKSNKSLELYFGIECEGYTEKLIIRLPFMVNKNYSLDYDTCLIDVKKGENDILITSKDKMPIEIENCYIELDNVIEFNDYYKKIEFPIYYPVMVGRIYSDTKAIPHIFNGKIENVIYPKIECLEIGINEADTNFTPDIKNSYPTPEIIRNNSLKWITGDNKAHSDLCAFFQNNKNIANRDKENFLHGILITFFISLLLFFIQTIVTILI